MEDQVFEDKIERLKQRNQMLLQRFKAECSASTVNNTANNQARLRNEDKERSRNKSYPPPPRPKSFVEVTRNGDRNITSYPNQEEESYKQRRFSRSQKVIDDEVAYQDYFHFQQTHGHRALQTNHYRSNNHLNDSHSYQYYSNSDYTPKFKDYRRSTSQKSKYPKKNSQNYYQTDYVRDPPNPKSSYNRNPYNDSQFKKYNNTYQKQAKNNAVNVKNPPIYLTNKKDKTTKAEPQTTPFDDEYIDDTLEDLEQYRLKINMEDFIVIDPESPDPILAMPLTPWTNDPVFTKLNGDHLQAGKSSIDVLNNANKRAKDYLNLVDQTNLDSFSRLDLSTGDEDIISN